MVVPKSINIVNSDYLVDDSYDVILVERITKDITLTMKDPPGSGIQIILKRTDTSNFKVNIKTQTFPVNDINTLDPYQSITLFSTDIQWVTISSCQQPIKQPYSLISRSSGSLTNLIGTYYMSQTGMTTDPNIAYIVITGDGYISNLTVRASVAPGTNCSRIFTLYVNGADTTLVCNISDTKIENSSSIEIAVSKYDLVAIKQVSSGLLLSPAIIWTGFSFRPYKVT